MEKVAVGDGVAYIARGDVILVLWQAPSRVARGRWLFEETAKIAATLPGFSYMQIVLPSSSPPDREMRAEANRWLNRFAPKLRTVVTVPIGDALWINVVRTIMRAMFMIQGRASTHFVFDTIDAGARKLRETASSETPTHDAMLGDVEALLRALGEDPALARRLR